MLWNYFKALKTLAPIYQGGFMEEDENSIPENYVILEENTFDESLIHGDGKSLVRKTSYNIRIHCRTLTKANSVTTAYRGVLAEKNLAYKQLGPTFDPTSKMYSTLLTGVSIYGI